MTLTPKKTIVCASILVLLAFSVGRWSSPEKVKIEIKTVEVEKKTDDKKVDTNDHKTIKIIEVDTPDGTKTKTTIITDNKDTKSDDKSTDDVTKTTDKTKEITKSSRSLTISALSAINIKSPRSPIYGLLVQRSLLGPITVGVFGLSNSSGGVSVGLTF